MQHFRNYTPRDFLIHIAVVAALGFIINLGLYFHILKLPPETPYHPHGSLR